MVNRSSLNNPISNEHKMNLTGVFWPGAASGTGVVTFNWGPINRESPAIRELGNRNETSSLKSRWTSPVGEPSTPPRNANSIMSRWYIAKKLFLSSDMLLCTTSSYRNICSTWLVHANVITCCYYLKLKLISRPHNLICFEHLCEHRSYCVSYGVPQTLVRWEHSIVWKADAH